MTLVRWTPRTPSRWGKDDSSLPHPWTMFDELFGLSPATSCDWMPALDVRENEGAYSVKVDLPGLSREQVEISFEGDVLTISGERKEESEKDDGQVHRSERFVGKFTRSLRFPGDVQPDKIDATFRDGVLQVTLPKAEEARKRRIEVK